MSKGDIHDSHWAYGHRPLITFRIVRNVPRPSAELVEQFRDFFIPDISDTVGQLYTMDSTIRPLYQPIRRLIGVALTAKIPPGDNSVVKRALRMVQPGDVLVVDARGHTQSAGGGAGMLVPPIDQGLAGVVVDGAWRDITELRALDFPIYGKGVSPYSGPKRRPGEINVPVCCGGVIVNPGDIVVCDEDGGVVVPRKHAEIVADRLSRNIRASVEDWEVERHAHLAEERDVWFEELFQAQDGVYVDWPDV